MQRITVHWVEMRTYEFSDEALVENETELIQWIDRHPEARGDWEYFAASSKNPGLGNRNLKGTPNGKQKREST